MSRSPDARRDLSALAGPYAHRGLWDRNVVPENSLAAFRAAADAGFGVELDVRLTADGVAVVFHDATLRRMCGDPRRLNEIHSQHLPTLELPDGSHILSLSEALTIMSPHPVLIELKVDVLGDLSVANAVLPVAASAPGSYALMSFDEATVAHVRRECAAGCVGLLIDGKDALGAAEISRKAAMAAEIGCDYIAPHHSSLALVAAQTHLPLITWTVRSADQLEMARLHGAAPIFENGHSGR